MQRGVGEVLDLRGREGTTEDVVLPIGEPLLEGLVATELVLPEAAGMLHQKAQAFR